MYFSLDIEGSMKPTLHPWQPEAFLSTISVVTNSGEERSWVFQHDETDVFQTDRARLTEIQGYIDAATVVVAHNAKFDLNWCVHLGLDFTSTRIFCTSVAEFILSGQTLKLEELSLNTLAKKYFKEEKYDQVKSEYWDQGINTDKVPLKVLLPYNVQDCALTLKLFEMQIKKLRSAGMIKLMSSEMDKLKCLCEIEVTGFKIDTVELAAQGERLVGELGVIDHRLQGVAGREFNINSGDQLSCVMFGGTWEEEGTEEVSRTYKSGLVRTYTRKCKVPITHEGLGFVPDDKWKLKKEGMYSTTKDTISQLKPQAKTKELKEFVRLLVDRSAKGQEYKTFVKGVGKRLYAGRVHPSMNNTITVTGRLSSSNPNLQNIPRGSTSETKKIFTSTLGALVEADFSQLEWRVAAFLSQCPVMMGEILRGEDQHAATGSDVFGGAGIRTDWKIFNFRMIYGGSPYSFYMDMKMPGFSKRKWEGIVSAFYEKYTGLKVWHDELVIQVRRNKGKLVTPTGRLLKFNKYPSRYGMDYRRPQILNYPVQSLAGDIVALAMKRIREHFARYGLDVRMINQIHDAVLADCLRSLREEIATVMVETFRQTPQLIEEHYGFKFNLPLDGDAKIGHNWFDMKEVAV